MRYSDCYPGCGGEDCPCCDVYVDHIYMQYHPDYDYDYSKYDVSREFYEDECPEDCTNCPISDTCEDCDN